MTRQAFTPVEFDATCRLLEFNCPWIWQTSGYRSVEHNAEVGGHVLSKHIIGMARDYVAKDQSGLNQAAAEARKLGLWVLIHDVGSGNHIHVQGLEKGAPPSWWLAKYGR